MGTYRKEWDCCGSVTETQAWEPETCPFCTPAAPSPTPISMGAPGGLTRDASAHSANGDDGRESRPAPVPPSNSAPTMDLNLLLQNISQSAYEQNWDAVDETCKSILARFAELERERDEAREGWHMANGVADLAMKHRDRAEALLRKLHPYVDSLICYASTLDEHEGNRIAKDVNDYFADDTIFDAAIAQRAGETG